MSDAQDWHAVIHAVVDCVGRHFGFQAFNTRAHDNSPAGSKDDHWTPATIFLVTDHLHHLLVKNYMTRDVQCTGHSERFARAVWMLHVAIFAGYHDWCTHVGLRARQKVEHAPNVASNPTATKRVEVEDMTSMDQPVTRDEVTLFLLEELSLFFLVYSEAANLRHTPEALWFIFWVMRNSPKRWKAVNTKLQPDNGPTWKAGLDSKFHIQLRNSKCFAPEIAACLKGEACLKDGACWDGMDIAKLSAAVLDAKGEVAAGRKRLIGSVQDQLMGMTRIYDSVPIVDMERARQLAEQLVPAAWTTTIQTLLEELIVLRDSGPVVDMACARQLAGQLVGVARKVEIETLLQGNEERARQLVEEVVLDEWAAEVQLLLEDMIAFEDSGPVLDKACARQLAEKLLLEARTKKMQLQLEDIIVRIMAGSDEDLEYARQRVKELVHSANVTKVELLFGRLIAHHDSGPYLDMACARQLAEQLVPQERITKVQSLLEEMIEFGNTSGAVDMESAKELARHLVQEAEVDNVWSLLKKMIMPGDSGPVVDMTCARQLADLLVPEAQNTQIDSLERLITTTFVPGESVHAVDMILPRKLAEQRMSSVRIAEVEALLMRMVVIGDSGPVVDMACASELAELLKWNARENEITSVLERMIMPRASASIVNRTFARELAELFWPGSRNAKVDELLMKVLRPDSVVDTECALGAWIQKVEFLLGKLVVRGNSGYVLSTACARQLAELLVDEAFSAQVQALLAKVVVFGVGGPHVDKACAKQLAEHLMHEAWSKNLRSLIWKKVTMEPSSTVSWAEELADNFVDEAWRTAESLLEQMIVFGDSGTFVDKVVEPIFAFLAVEVYEKGEKGLDIALRIPYDDVNESLASKAVVEKVKDSLLLPDKDPLDILLAIGMPRNTPNAVGLNMVGRKCETVRARDWWAEKCFGKTYMERRSLFTMYRTFFRVWVMFILEFQVMASVLWAPGSNYVISYTCLTHAFLSLIEQFAGFWTQRPLRELPDTKEEEKKQVKAKLPQGPCYHVGMAVWLIIFLLLGAALGLQLAGMSKSIWWIACITYTGSVTTYAVLGTRDGYCISVNNAIADFFDPIHCHTSIYLIFKPLNMLFKLLSKMSARPPAEVYLAPYKMKAGLRDSFANGVFWAFVLSMKFAFDWFAVMKQLELPIKGLWDRNWVNWPFDLGIDGDFFLCAARCLPGFLVMFNDTQIFYYIGVGVFGFARGFFRLNLGNIISFQQLVTTFHKAPTRWSKVCVANPSVSKDSGQERHKESSRVTGDSANTTPNRQHLRPAEDGRSASCSPDSVRDSAASNVSTLNTPRGSPMTAHTQAQSDDQQPAAAVEPTSENGQQESATQGSGARNNRQHSTPSRWNQCWDAERSKVHTTFSDDNIPKWRQFSAVWNEIVLELRSADLLSDKEVENLLFVELKNLAGLKVPTTFEFPHGVPSRGFIPPVFFYGGQIDRLLEVPGVDSGQELAVKDMWALLVWILFQLNIVDERTADELVKFTPHRSTRSMDRRKQRQEVKTALLGFLDGIIAMSGKPNRTEREKLKRNLEKLCTILKDEAEAIHAKYPNQNDDRHKNATSLIAAVNELSSSSADPAPINISDTVWRRVELELEILSSRINGNQATKQLVPLVAKQLKRMLVTTGRQAAPAGDEALRVLTWFMSSLKDPTIPELPPLVEHMTSFNTLTPHYNEPVVYALDAAQVGQDFGGLSHSGLDDLTTENDDSISVMHWLRSAYPNDWRNLLERLQKGHKELFTRIPDDRNISEKDFDDYGGALAPLREELLLWAAYRGQHLARTVRGIMEYGKAIRLLARLEHPRLELSPKEHEAWLDEVVASKFTYIVASQAYGDNRTSKEAKFRWMARGTEMLLVRFPGLRVAYVDTLSSTENRCNQQWSVLIQAKQLGPRQLSPLADLKTDFTEEVYRIRLPQNMLRPNKGVILGEGKPENQNAAIIFCFGEVVQAIDMNQDNNLAEALKMRNLLSEFEVPKHPPGPNGKKNVVSWPNMKATDKRPVCLVGFREYIFSQDSGALASFAAATELAFGSMAQRVMCWPGSVRFHYGHPDLWSKLFIMTRGGVSKATKGLHVSEDVYAGYNHVLRGGRIKFVEYINCGKGRDMGFDSILGFEAKVASGNGEQVMSRDVHRIATNFDFFRLLSFYHSGCGFYINTYLVMLSVYISLCVTVILVLTNSQTVVDPEGDQINTLTGKVNTQSVQQTVQLGMLSIVVYLVELVLAKGIIRALGTILTQIFQGSVLFYIFRSRTAAYYFQTDVQYGGAKYIGTGRGYQLLHNSFVNVYTKYARSHIYYAVELVVLMILLALIGTNQFFQTTWSAWLVAGSLLWAPFWFNPYTFQPERVAQDFEQWRAWMRDVKEPKSGSTWSSWNKEQLEKPRDDEHNQTDRFSTAILGVLSSLPTASLGVAAVSHIEDSNWYKWWLFCAVTGVFWGGLILGMSLKYILIRNSRYRSWRVCRMLSLALALTCGVAAIVLAVTGNNGSVGLGNMFILAFANTQMVVVLVKFIIFFTPSWRAGRYAVDRCFKILDWTIGYCLFFILFICSILMVIDLIQGALLFNLRFTKALQRGRLMEVNFLANYINNAVQKAIHRPQPGQENSGSRGSADATRTHDSGISPSQTAAGSVGIRAPNTGGNSGAYERSDRDNPASHEAGGSAGAGSSGHVEMDSALSSTSMEMVAAFLQADMSSRQALEIRRFHTRLRGSF